MSWDAAINAQNAAIASKIRPSPFIGEAPDIIDRLPAASQTVLAGLRDQCDTLSVLVRSTVEKEREAATDRNEARTNYLVLTDKWTASRYGAVSILAEDDPQAIAAKERLDKAEQKHEQATARRDELHQRFTAWKRLLDSAERYVATLDDVKSAPPPSFKQPSADRIAAEVEKIRKTVADLQADRHEILSAAYPSDVVKKRARAEIEELARRGKPNVLPMIDHGPQEGVHWPDFTAKGHHPHMLVPLPGDTGHTRDVPGSHMALLAWMFRDRLIEAIESEIDACAEDEGALTDEQRTSKLADVEKRILDAERIEAALVHCAGGTIDPRDDMDPRAVLGIDGPKPRED